MNAPTRAFPVWLRVLCYIFGIGLIGACLWAFFVTGVAFWLLLHSKQGLMLKNGTVLAQLLGRFTGEVIVLCLGIWLVRLPTRSKRQAAKAQQAGLAQSVTHAPATNFAAKKVRRSPVHACNVLQLSGNGGRLWQFDARNGGFVLAREHRSSTGEPVAPRLVAKDWRSLYQRKLNVAWLPPEQVFLRVAQFPQSSLEETASMVELQLEKLSPMPVAQVVWSLHTLPSIETNMQTVIVIIVARNVVEEFLGKLEGQGFLADRLELPVLDQLQAADGRQNGAFIYPEAQGGPGSALVAWWSGGVLRNLDLLTLPAANRGAELKEQLMQMAWAGEMEGWLTEPPSFHLVAEGSSVAEWEAPLREGLGGEVQVSAPLPERDLAAMTARRAATAETPINLLPAEFSERYRQQFIDRLWMRGLFTVMGVYVAGVLIYLVALQVLLFQTRSVEKRWHDLSTTYTNAMQLDARYHVLKERQDLKYAGLNCYKAIAELLPDTLTLESMNFSEGKRLSLQGTAPSDQRQDILGFDAALRKYKDPTDPTGDDMFEPNSGEAVTYRSNPGSASVTWSLVVLLKKAEGS